MADRKMIYLDDAIDAVAEGLKRTFVEYRDVAEKMLNKVPSAQPEQIARDIATIIENEKDMRVILQNTERTETHSCDCERTETHGWIPVTEALPEDACQCIVTAKVKHVDNYPDYEVDTADFADGIFTTANSWWGVESIIAWMPLPEPYKEGEK